MTPVEPFLPQAPSSDIKKTPERTGAKAPGAVDAPVFLKPGGEDSGVKEERGEKEEALLTSQDGNTEDGKEEKGNTKTRDRDRDPDPDQNCQEDPDKDAEASTRDEIHPEASGIDETSVRDRAGSDGSAGLHGGNEIAKSILESTDTVDPKGDTTDAALGDSSSSEGQPSTAGKPPLKRAETVEGSAEASEMPAAEVQ